MNGYEAEVATMVDEMKAGFALAQACVATYTTSQFVEVLRKELRAIDLKINAIIRSGQHPSDNLRVQYFAHEQLIAELA